MRELIEQARLADARLADDGHHLAVAGSRSLQRLAKLLDLSVAPDEAREAARGRGLQPRARRSRAGNLIDLHRLAQSLHVDRAERLHLHVAFG